MNPYHVGAIVFFGIGLSCTYLGVLLTLVLIGKVNRYRAEDNQIAYFGFPCPRAKNLENLWIFGEYRHLYPNGRLHIYLLIDFAGWFIGLIGAITCLFLGPKFSGGP